MTGRHARKSWVMYFPRGLREQSAWVFIGLMLVLSGLTWATGISDSAISRAIGNGGLRAWGVSLSVTGVLLISATISARPALEKLSHRILIINIGLYLGWLLVVVPVNAAAPSMLLGGALIVLSGFRIWHLKSLMQAENRLRQLVGAAHE